jgi:hypothetical protein
MSAHVCPSIVPTGRRETELLAAIRARGLSLHRVHRDGAAIRLTGPGVHVIAAGLASLWLTDLAPPSGAEIKALMRVINKA